MHNPNVGADRNDTALSCTVDMPGGQFDVREIHLLFYCRSFRLSVLPIGGFAGPIFVAYSRRALFGAISFSAGYHTLFPGEEAMERYFVRDDEGPPTIFIANASFSTNRVLFAYFPTRKRDGSTPSVAPGNRDFPGIVVRGSMVQPGV